MVVLANIKIRIALLHMSWGLTLIFSTCSCSRSLAHWDSLKIENSTCACRHRDTYVNVCVSLLLRYFLFIDLKPKRTKMTNANA